MVACGTNLSGTFVKEGWNTTEYKFKGDTVTEIIVDMPPGLPASGSVTYKYKLGTDDNGNQTITFSSPTLHGGIMTLRINYAYFFSQGEDSTGSYIMLDSEKYYKKK